MKLPSKHTRAQDTASTQRFFFSKQILLFVAMFVGILLLDGVLCLFFLAGEAYNLSKTSDGRSVISTLSNSLEQKESGEYAVNSDTDSSKSILQLMDENDYGAILVSTEGDVVWSYKAPSTLPAHFSTNDIALIAHNRAWDEYPVLIWTRDDGILMLFSPPASLITAVVSLPEETFLRIPLYVTLLLLVDALIFFLFYLISRRNVVKYVDPALGALDNLAQGKAVKVSFSGPLRSIGNKINRVSDTLIRKETARKNWVEGVSHDVRTPLAVIMGRAETIEQTSNDSFVRQSAQTITQQSIRIRDLVEDLNIATQLEYDMQPLRNDNILVSRMLREVVADNLNRENEKDYQITLSIMPCANRITLQGDEKLLRRALQNALNNSIKHNPKGCTIDISLACNSDSFWISVRDNGRGMSPSTLTALLLRLDQETRDVLTFASPNKKTPAPPSAYSSENKAVNTHTSALTEEAACTTIVTPIATPPSSQESKNQQTQHNEFNIHSSTSWKNGHVNPAIKGQDYKPSHQPTANLLARKTLEKFQPSEAPNEQTIKCNAQTYGGAIQDSAQRQDLTSNQTSTKTAAVIRQHGVGLSLISRIVITHGGSLSIESNPEKGFCLTMTFPLSSVSYNQPS